MKKEALSLLALTTLLGLGGCVDRKAQVEGAELGKIVGDPAKTVVVAAPKVEDIEDVIEVNGEVVTSDDAQISSVASGKLVAVYLRDGDNVSAGQVVATLDSENAQQQVAQARAGLASAVAQLSQAKANARLAPNRTQAAVRQAEAVLKSAKAQLAKALAGARTEEKSQAENNLRAAKSNLDTAKKNLERTRTLVKEGALAEAQLDTAKNTYEAALAQYENALAAQSIVRSATRPEDIEAAKEAVRQAEQGVASAKATKNLDVTLGDQVMAAEAQVNSARAQVSVAEKNLRETTIRAPFSGRVYGKPLQVGTVVAPGTPIARLVSGQGIYFEGQVPSDQISKVQPGTPVVIGTDGTGDSKFFGKVVAISGQGDTVGRLFNVRVVFIGSAEGVKPGMSAKGGIQLDKISGATLVPGSAVQSKDGKRFVVVAQDNKAKRIYVTVGLRKGDLTEVKGLPSDAQVIVKGQEGLVDGSVLKVVKK